MVSCRELLDPFFRLVVYFLQFVSVEAAKLRHCDDLCFSVANFNGCWLILVYVMLFFQLTGCFSLEFCCRGLCGCNITVSDAHYLFIGFKRKKVDLGLVVSYFWEILALKVVVKRVQLAVCNRVWIEVSVVDCDFLDVEVRVVKCAFCGRIVFYMIPPVGWCTPSVLGSSWGGRGHFNGLL